MHLAEDTYSELPTALEVTPAHIHDDDEEPNLMAQSIKILDTKTEYFIMDTGYDQHKNYKVVHEHSSQAIFPFNMRNEKELLEGMMSNGTL